MLMPRYKKVSNPRDDLTPHSKITQLLGSRCMVNAVKSLGEVCDYPSTNCISFISTFVEHIKELKQTVGGSGAFNTSILVTIQRM